MSEELNLGEIRDAEIHVPKVWYEHPFWSISGWLIAVFLSVLFFFLSKDVWQLTYSFPEPQRIFSASKSERIRVIGPNNKTVDADIFLQEIALWNSGNRGIEPEEVREPIKFGLELINDGGQARSDFEILEVKILREVSRRSSQVKIHRQNDYEFSISWSHFDSTDGVRLQVLYSTPYGESLPFAIRGAVAEMNTFVNGDVQTVRRIIPRLPNWGAWVLFFVVYAIGAYFLSRLITIARRTGAPKLIVGLVYWVVIPGGIFGLIYFLFPIFLASNAPPI